MYVDIQQLKLAFYGSFHQPIAVMGRTINVLLDGRLSGLCNYQSFQNIKLLASQMMNCVEESSLPKDVFPLLLQNWDELLGVVESAQASQANAPF